MHTKSKLGLLGMVIGLGLTGCMSELGGAEDEVVFDGTLVDDVLLAPEGSSSTEALSGGAPQVIYLNFDGGRIDDCSGYCSDAPSNRSWAIGELYGRSSVTFAPYGGDRGLITRFIQERFAAYNVRVVTGRPASAPYTMVMISPTHGPNHGAAPLDCGNANPNDIAFIMKADTWSAQRNAQGVAHELGHSFGLGHVSNSGEFMDWASRGAGLGSSHYDTGHPSGKCFSGSVQNGPELLRGALGDYREAPEDPAVRARNEAFVTALYRDFLKRGASAAEIDGHADRLRRGESRAQVAASFAGTDEWIGALVDGYYRSTLGREPDPGGRSHWINVLRSGQTPAQVAAYFYASDEYYGRAGGTNRAWVTDLYRQILHREPDSGGLGHWTGEADRGVSRSTIAYNFYQSLESRRDRVRGLYQALLGRNPDSGGWSHWADVLNNGRDVELAVSLASSAEYYQRADRRF